jgi:Tc toxin complex TcA C-terminal TcB-binding domain/Neuraminidase-like domain
MDLDSLIALHRVADEPVGAIAAKDPELFDHLSADARSRLRDSILKTFADAPAETHAAVAQANLDAVVRGEATLRGALTDALSLADLPADALNDGLRRMGSLAAAADASLQDAAVRDNPLFAPQLARAGVATLVSGIGLPRRQVEGVVKQVPSLDALTADALAHLRRARTISPKAADQLGFAMTVHNLVDRDVRLTEALRAHVKDLPSLAALDARGWTRMLGDTGVEPPGGISREQHARDLAERAATLLPTDATIGRLLPSGSTGLAGRVAKLSDQARHELARALPALGLDEALADRSLSAKQRTALFAERLGLLEQVRERNAALELLNLDYTSGSRDLERLDLDGLDGEQRQMTIATLAALQRVQTLAGAHASTLLKAGLHSATAVLRAGDQGLERAGVEQQQTTGILNRARDRVEATLAGLGTLIDLGRGGLGSLAVDNAAPDIKDFLRDFGGYAALFGNQDFCNCDHCESILSPAAYVVDLMCFIDEHITVPTFTGNEDHPLHPRVRRPDLWTLPLTCANTDDLLATLDIINPILESYIAKRLQPAIDLSDRRYVEQVVYERLAAAGESFQQPFALAQTQLDALLERGEVRRADVARAVGASAEVVTSADLHLSSAQHAVLTTPKATKTEQQRRYNMTLVSGSNVDAIDAQDLLGPMGVTRDQLGALVKTQFVAEAAAAGDPLRIVAAKRDADSVQNDVEQVRGLTLEVLDRLHRFTRLWRACDRWTVDELDLVLRQLGAAEISEDALEGACDVRALQQRLNVTVEQATALFTDLPATELDGKPSLVDRLFNTGAGAADGPHLPSAAVRFVHPALRATATDDGQALLHRLMAGLGIGDGDLLALVRALAGPLGFDPEAASEDDRGFPLTSASLSLLYRHARLSNGLRRKLADLFALIALAGLPAGAVSDRDELHVLLDLDAWLSRTGFKVDGLAYITGGPAPADAAHPDPATVATQLVGEIARDRALVLADTAFTAIDGVTPDQSRAVIAANGAVIEPLPDGTGFRAMRTFAAGDALTVPAGVPATAAALRDVLLATHASTVVPARLAAHLRDQPDRVAALLALADVDLWAPDTWDELWAAVAPAQLTTAVAAIGPLRALYASSRFDADTITFIAARPAALGLPDPLHPTLEAARQAGAYAALMDYLEADRPADQGDLNPADARGALAAIATAGLAGADPAVLGRVIGAPSAVAAGAQAAVSVAATATAVGVLGAYARVAALSHQLGVSAMTLTKIASEDATDQATAVQALLSALHVAYVDDKSWEDNVEPALNRIRGRKRDALCDYLMTAIHPEFADRSALYRYFLIDVDLEGCSRTTLVSAAISSAQLYVHRCRMNLEQDNRGSGDPRHIHVRPRLVPSDEWEWRKNYRVWEANRKVFLWPENYIEPELRDDKTPLFKDLESTLLQQKIDEQNVLDAYTTYLHGFEELATLKIAGAFHQTGELNGRTGDVLHLFGVTNGDPPTFYYRTAENLYTARTQDARGVVWSPWQKVNVQIPVRDVGPVVYHGRLYLLWAEYKTRSFNDVSGGASHFAGYRHTMAMKFTALRLDGTWTPPQEINLKINAAPFPVEAGVYVDNTFINVGFVTINLPPRFDSVVHTDAHEDYHPRFPGWERVVPQVDDSGRLAVTARNFQLNAHVDLRRRMLSDPTSPHPYQPGWSLPLLSELDTASPRRLYFGYPQWYLCTENAMAELMLQRSRIAEFGRDWAQLNNVESGLYGEALVQLPNQTDLRSVANQITDAIIEADGDALLVQASITDGARYSITRIGTTLADGLSERLFTAGVDGLLDMRYQLSLSEARLPVSIQSWRVSDDSNAGTLDYRGAYGTYYREVFFHVPFLIANYLNSQGNYAAAQRWYHYIFDPTADDDERRWEKSDGGWNPQQLAQLARDRVWRYRELRGLDVPKLRQALTDPVALEVYRKDPFNPHAIARLRLTAYQQAIVMKYVDNLLDWADDLFTQFTTESVTEATMLYVMAGDILGRRPADLGDCGEDEAVRTFAAIQPLVTEGHEILIELETWSIAHREGRLVDKVTLERPLELAAVAGADRMRRLVAGGAGTLASPASAPAEHAARSDAPVARVAPVLRREALFDGASWKRTDTASWVDAVRGDGSERLIGHASSGHDGTHRPWKFGWSVLRQVTPVFCVPANKDLRAYWTRLEDRLYKIHNCMDITGTVRQLAPYAPEIDPMLLVRAKAAGLSIDDVLAMAAAEAPPYRFTFLLDRAKAYAATLQGFGSALLSALEKRDLEALARLRNTQQRDLLNLTTRAREADLHAAEQGKQQVELQLQAAHDRMDYYQGLIDTGRTPWEVTQSVSRHVASGLTGGAATLRAVAGVMYLIPQVGSPFAMKYGGQELGNSVNTWSSVARDLAGVAEAVASSAGLEAGFDRRDQGWRFQRDTVKAEIQQLEVAAQVAEQRRVMADRALTIHNATIDQNDEIVEFYASKFSSLGLYTWLSSTLQQVYRDAYNAALALALDAERAYQYERDDPGAPTLAGGTWAGANCGLLAGERLTTGLQALERRYLESNYRTLEVDQPFALSQIDPAALLRLRGTGSCEFSIPEAALDLSYPGQYRRRVKSVRVTIPCITGPYTNISATLTLTGSRVRPDPVLGADKLKDVPLQRVHSVATSTAQGDAGVFELSFRDERYLPFEGAGAISSWKLEMPEHFHQFDYSTINDIILNISYSAQSDGLLRTKVEDINAALEGSLKAWLQDTTLTRVFSLRQDFSAAFVRLLKSPTGTLVPLEISDRFFPIFLRGLDLTITNVRLAATTQDGVATAGLKLKANGTALDALAADASLGGLRAANASAPFGNSLPATLALEVTAAGAAAPDPQPGVPATTTIDDRKLLDLLLVVDYSAA